ncbi:LIM domain-containing protein 2 isoform X1 [Rhinolophus sinicus]|uniref:LIM domain-containing protein 2 isoform X1 n=1 Tax=Rhinolophus sinicus TaxID=89399 RepID=UPI003D7B98C7
MQRWALRLRSLPWFGVGRRGGRLREDCEGEKRGVRAGGGKQRPGPRARERQSAQRVGGGAGAPEAAPGAAEPMGGRGAGAGGGGAAIRRWRRRPLGDHWQAAVARARTLFAPEAPHGDRSPVPRPRPGPGSQRQQWQQHCSALQVLQPSGPGKGDLCRLSEDRVPHGAVGGRQAHFPQLMLLLQALSHQAEPGQLRGSARGILLQTPLSAAV